jgi:hypothetical protein
MQKFEEYFVAFWCLTMPITSFILIPEVQGTIIAYMMAFLSLGFVLLKIRDGRIPSTVVGYFKKFATIFALWLLLFCGSQLGDAINPQMDVQDMFELSPETGLMFHSSLFTQSLYLLACVMIMLYFRYFFQEKWLKYTYWGAWFLAIYGLYDWTFYLVFHESGDFIANRTFAQSDHPGSWSQGLNVAGVQVLRLKSCLGEPSFFSAVVIPYFFMALEGKKKILAALLFISAILSTSTTVYFGLIASIFIQGLWTPKGRKTSFAAVGVVILVIIGMAIVVPDTYRFLFEDKLSGDTESGQVRLDNISEYIRLYSQFGPVNWLFGVGFGYLYFSLLWSITANCGLIGLGIFLYAFLKPAYQLPHAPGTQWLKISMVAILIVVAITLTELFIPTTWMFLGLAYRKLDQLDHARELAQLKRARPAAPAELKPALA